MEGTVLPQPAHDSGTERIPIYGICRFPAPVRTRSDEFRESVVRWIEQQATEAWAPEEYGARAQAAIDFLTVRMKPIPPHLEAGEVEARVQVAQMGQPPSSTNTGQTLGQTSGHGRRHGRYTGGPPTSSEKDLRNRQKTEKRREDVVG